MSLGFGSSRVKTPAGQKYAVVVKRMSSEDVYLEPALVLCGDTLERRLERILEESWAEFAVEQRLPAGAARLDQRHTGHAQHQHQHHHVAHDGQSPPLD